MTGLGVALVYLRCQACGHAWEISERRSTPNRTGARWW
jgi:hypothetical protein